jgi:uncharacterized protein with PQ loop repeat
MKKMFHIHLAKKNLSEPVEYYRDIDKLIYVVGIVEPLMTIPQILQIYIGKNVAGVSLFSWTSFLCFGIVWLIYGLIHKSKPIIFTYTIWIIVEAIICFGVILYR